MKLEEFSFGSGLSGLKIAKVIYIKDPKGQQRILVRVMGQHQLTFVDELEDKPDDWKIDYGIWALSCSPFRKGGDLPQPGDFVWCLFPNVNDHMLIVYLGFVRASVQNEILKAKPISINSTETEANNS